MNRQIETGFQDGTFFCHSKGVFRAFDKGLTILEEMSAEALPWWQKCLDKYEEILKNHA